MVSNDVRVDEIIRFGAEHQGGCLAKTHLDIDGAQCGQPRGNTNRLCRTMGLARVGCNHNQHGESVTKADEAVRLGDDPVEQAKSAKRDRSGCGNFEASGGIRAGRDLHAGGNERLKRSGVDAENGVVQEIQIDLDPRTLRGSRESEPELMGTFFRSGSEQNTEGFGRLCLRLVIHDCHGIDLIGEGEKIQWRECRKVERRMRVFRGIRQPFEMASGTHVVDTVPQRMDS